MHLRRLTLALLFSGVLNILLLTLFFYWIIREKPPLPYFQHKPTEQILPESIIVKDSSTDEILQRFRQFSIEQLTAKLSHTELVENGYTQRDLALASLVTLHHFDLPRALKGLSYPLQQRKLSFRSEGKEYPLTIYSGLTEAQYQAILEFVQTEKWPFTSHGLFLIWKQQAEKQQDPTLAEAIYLTPEFMSVETLFNRNGNAPDKKKLLQMLAEGSWESLHDFAEQQRMTQDLSPGRRLQFLLTYLSQGSTTAAYTLLSLDLNFVSKKLDDTTICQLLALLTRKTEEAQAFALQMLQSPRSDQVRYAAAARLYEFAGEQVPTTYSYNEVLSHFGLVNTAPKKNSPMKPPMVYQTKEVALVSPAPKPKNNPTVPKTKTYVVAERDTLWKIARKHKVSVDALKKQNNLKSDTLRTGMTLKIP